MRTLVILLLMAAWAYYFNESFIKFWGNFLILADDVVSGIINVYLSHKGVNQ